MLHRGGGNDEHSETVSFSDSTRFTYHQPRTFFFSDGRINRCIATELWRWHAINDAGFRTHFISLYSKDGRPETIQRMDSPIFKLAVHSFSDCRHFYFYAGIHLTQNKTKRFSILNSIHNY